MLNAGSASLVVCPKTKEDVDTFVSCVLGGVINSCSKDTDCGDEKCADIVLLDQNIELKGMVRCNSERGYHFR